MTSIEHLNRLVAALNAYRAHVPDEVRVFIDAPAQESVRALEEVVNPHVENNGG